MPLLSLRPARWALALGLLLAPAAQADQEPLGPLPATWVGTIPGASEAIRWHLDLEPDGTYQLRLTDLTNDPERGFDAIGRWRQDPGSGRLVLGRDREKPLFLQPILGGNALRKLDQQGQRIPSQSNDRLTRLGQPAPIEPRLQLVGLFRYLADAPSLQLCATGRTLPVAMEADYLALERAYLQRGAAGAPRLAVLAGLITTRPSAEDSQPAQRTVVVERFASLSEAQSCPGVEAMPLRATVWRLDSLDAGETPAQPPVISRPVELVFDKASDRVSGSGGCNRLSGGITVEGSSLSFSPLASTRMACRAEVMAFEDRFHRALQQVRSWRIHGTQLELLDGRGMPLLHFEAAG